MFEVFMMIGVVCYAIGFGFLQFAFLRWLFKNDSLSVRSGVLYAYWVRLSDDRMLFFVMFHMEQIEKPPPKRGLFDVRGFRVCWRRSDTAEYRRESQG